MDTRILFLIKLGEYENLKKLQQGKLYFKNLKYYSELERTTGDSSMGDSLEGLYRTTQGSFELYDKKTGKLIYTANNITNVIKYETVYKMPVFCMIGIKNTDLPFEKIDDSFIGCNINLFNIIENMSEKSYWGSALFIIDNNEFIKRVITACEKQGISCRCKPVQYTDMNINYKDRIEDIDNNKFNIAFWKDNSYSKQYEYRIILEGLKVEDSYTLDIGDISDITILKKSDEIKEYLDKTLTIKMRINDKV